MRRRVGWRSRRVHARRRDQIGREQPDLTDIGLFVRFQGHSGEDLIASAEQERAREVEILRGPVGEPGCHDARQGPLRLEQGGR